VLLLVDEFVGGGATASQIVDRFLSASIPVMFVDQISVVENKSIAA
jgi:hypothetical protein